MCGRSLGETLFAVGWFQQGPNCVPDAQRNSLRAAANSACGTPGPRLCFVKICLLVSVSMESRAACSILGRCVTFKFRVGSILTNVSSSLAVALDVSEIRSSSDVSSGDMGFMSDSRLYFFCLETSSYRTE